MRCFGGGGWLHVFGGCTVIIFISSPSVKRLVRVWAAGLLLF